MLELQGVNSYTPYRVIALDPNPAAKCESITHPHVRDEHLCAGNGYDAIRSALEQGRLYDFFMLVNRVLHTYARGEAYSELNDWQGIRCADCDATTSEESRRACPECEAWICEDCGHACQSCDQDCCGQCAAQCPRCRQWHCPEVAPNFRTLQVLGLAVRLQHQGVCRGEEIDSQEAWCASFVR